MIGLPKHCSKLTAGFCRLSRIRNQIFLIPSYKALYFVPDNLSRARTLPLNEVLEAVLTKVPQSSRLANISIKELSVLESSFRAQAEALSHSMWVLTGLITFLKQDGYFPSDSVLFNQFI